MYRSYIFVRIVTDPYFCHSQGRLLCIKMPHCVFLKNGVSGEACYSFFPIIYGNIFQWIFIQRTWTSAF